MSKAYRSLQLYLFKSCSVLFVLLCYSCKENNPAVDNMTVLDENLYLELIAQEPEIMTPIGMTIDDQDDIYILESHTDSVKEGYLGPKYDRIKKSIDKDKDGFPEDWRVYADSIVDGMNLAYSSEHGLFLTTKNSLLNYLDTNADGKGDIKKKLLEMVRPNDVYDHAGILGVALGPDDWVYVSRGNTGGAYWRVEGSDGSSIEGFGDGGNVMRCKVDGSRLEQVATGFWNPFDLKFNKEGRLFATDNDPDSRGPNRLLEIVPGGDYGYKSLYGASGIHPYQSWNGELPGTLPYAAPLGEAPCALIDAANTNFGNDHKSQLLVNVWEENNLVRILLNSDGSTVRGEPEVLVQGDSLFHPVALATNSTGDLYISDWVLRAYPNHGKGKVWRIKSKTGTLRSSSNKVLVDRFVKDERNSTELISALTNTDSFEQAMARHYLAQRAVTSELVRLLKDKDPKLRLQSLLTFFQREEVLSIADIKRLLIDVDKEVRKMTLIYIGTKGVTDLGPKLNTMLKENKIESELFEVFLATIRHLQPEFIEGHETKSGKSAKVKRELPPFFIENILKNPYINEAVKTMALPYLPDLRSNAALIAEMLIKAKEETLQTALIRAARETKPSEVSESLKEVCLNNANSDKVRSMALLELSYFPKQYFHEFLPLLKSEGQVLQYAAIKYLCQTLQEESERAVVETWIEENIDTLSEISLSIWKNCNGKKMGSSINKELFESVNGKGNVEIGQLVYDNRASLCTTCHKVKGSGGNFGPDLSKIASSKSKSQLINAILNPSLEISPEWQGWFLVDQDGVRHTGRQINIHEDFAELMSVNGDYDKYMHPKSYGAMKNSVMPEGLQNGMTLPEFNNLISYLMTLN